MQNNRCVHYNILISIGRSENYPIEGLFFLQTKEQTARDRKPNT